MLQLTNPVTAMNNQAAGKNFSAARLAALSARSLVTKKFTNIAMAPIGVSARSASRFLAAQRKGR